MGFEAVPTPPSEPHDPTQPEWPTGEAASPEFDKINDEAPDDAEPFVEQESPPLNDEAIE